MTFRMYLLLMLIGTVLSWVAWTTVIFSLNPLESGYLAFVMFYLTALMGLVGLFTVLGVTYRVSIRGRQEILGRQVRVSFRHAIFLSVIAIAALALSAQGWLKWWALIIAIVVTSGVEYLFLVKEEARRG